MYFLLILPFYPHVSNDKILKWIKRSVKKKWIKLALPYILSYISWEFKVRGHGSEIGVLTIPVCKDYGHILYKILRVSRIFSRIERFSR